MSHWETSRGHLENLMPLDGDTGILTFEDIYGNFSSLMTLDIDAGWCYSAATDHMFSSSGFSSVLSMPSPSLDPLNFVEDNSKTLPMTEISSINNSLVTSYNCGDKGMFQHLDTVITFEIDSNGVNDTESKQNDVVDRCSFVVSRPFGLSLDERMLRALSLFKESSGGGILAQVWVPMKHGNQYVLTTSEQPYLLDQMLVGFREVSRMFTFSIEGKPSPDLGLPGRVFTSKIPEWTSNVSFYKKGEYLRVDHAIGHDIRGSIALPVRDCQSEIPCCAVLELVTNKEKRNFDAEMEVVGQALQAVNLSTSLPPQLLPQCLTNGHKSALAEIADVLRAVCYAHKLPLALTWIPWCYNTGVGDGFTRAHMKDSIIGPDKKCILCIEETASYVNDKTMQDFVSACANHHLLEGQGIVGKALQSSHPFFNPDVKAYDINEYPLVHHVRKFGLTAAVAIRLRSTYTSDEDYILELFLPVNMTGSLEQQLLLNYLSGTMQRICRSLRTVSNVDLVCSEHPKDGIQAEAVQKFAPIFISNSQPRQSDSSSTMEKQKLSNSDNDGVEMKRSSRMKTSESLSHLKKKVSTVEKNVSLSVLQQHFSGSLKDAAKSIGVCPTTLKRICRKHGISRWPSQKIKKVNQSLKKIQTVLDSVQGVEGGLKFDPSTGGLIASAAAMEEFKSQSCFLSPKKKSPSDEAPAFTYSISVPQEVPVKLEKDECLLGGDSIITSMSLLNKKSDILPVDISDDSKSSISLAGDEEDTGGEPGHEVVEYDHPLSSSSTNSSSGSQTVIHGSSSGGFQSFNGWKQSKDRISCIDSGSKITVKASFGEDTIRFKYDPSLNYFQLCEEVAKRFKLPGGSFEIKYLDDEKEWVVLASDSDLQECLEIMEDFGPRIVKLLVRDRQFGGSSSASSSSFLSRE